MGRTVVLRGIYTGQCTGSVWDIPGIPGLRNGKDSGIERSLDSAWDLSGCSQHPGTLGWEGQLVSSPDTPPTRGKECLVAIDAKLGPMTSLSLTSVGAVWA